MFPGSGSPFERFRLVALHRDKLCTIVVVILGFADGCGEGDSRANAGAVSTEVSPVSFTVDSIRSGYFFE